MAPTKLQPPGSSPELVLRTYFHAKDENRPHLLDRVFAEDASLLVHNASGNIAFPAVTRGREAIATVLVGSFNQTYENIYSFYLARPSALTASFKCGWLVGMTEKDSKAVRVGCGHYEWRFNATPPYLAHELAIHIRAMQVLPPASHQAVLPWLCSLSYPWSSVAEVLAQAPSLPALAPVLEQLPGHETAA